MNAEVPVSQKDEEKKFEEIPLSTPKEVKPVSRNRGESQFEELANVKISDDEKESGLLNEYEFKE